MTNVFTIKPPHEPLGPFQTIRGLHALYERLGQLNADMALLDQKLSREPQSIDQNAIARQALGKASALASSSANELLEAIAGLIAETTARLIVPSKPHDQRAD